MVLVTFDLDGDNAHSGAATTYTYTATVDQDMSRMDNLLDQWTIDLKRNIMVRCQTFATV